MADKSVNEAPDPDSQEFLDEQNTVERQAPGTNADEAGSEPGVLPDEPPLVGEDLTERAPKSD